MTGSLHIRLFGGFSYSGAGIAPGAVVAPRQQALLAYLLLHRDTPQSRQRIAFQFWPDSTDAQAQTNLRQLLYHLRRACPALEPYIQADAKHLWWQGELDYTLDVAQFENLVALADGVTDDAAAAFLQRAVSFYTGDLFPECYEHWIVPHRQRLRGLYVGALEQLAETLAERHDLPQAIAAAEQLIGHDPLHEAGYRRLMQLHALNHNRAAALRTYDVCATTLRRELDVDPDPETQAQYERVLGAEEPEHEPARRTAFALAGELLPLVGRSREWALFQRAWHHIRGGRAHFVLIHGEAGIGKTRLLEELGNWAALQGATVAQARVYMGQDRLAYSPITAWLRGAALRDRLAALDAVWLTEVARLVPELLVDHPDTPAPQPMTDNWQRQRFYDALAQAIVERTEARPLVLLLDDLQWCDRETLAWLSYVLAVAADRPLLLVATMRTGDVAADHPVLATLAAWRQGHSLTEIAPRPLDGAETAQLAAAVAGHEWDADAAAILYRETEGNPLFIVEMVRAGQEQLDDGVEAPITTGGTVLPARVQAIVEARLRGLGTVARKLAELAAVIGREFRFDVLARASQLDDEALVRGLDELLARHIIREQSSDIYDFSHDKLRAVAYHQISTARRRLLHRQVAESLAAVHSHDTDAVSAQLASHYQQAGMAAEALRAYQQAAGVAQCVYANEDVIAFLQQALALLETLPPGRERDAQELHLLVELGPPLVALEGYSAEGVTTVYKRVLELCARLDRPPDPRALRALAIARILQGRHAESASLGHQILSLKAAAHDPVLMTEGYYAVGVAAFWQGEFTTARHYLEKALAHFSPERRALHITRYAQDPEVVCLSRLAYTLWHLGYPDQAWRTIEEVITGCAAQDHPYSRTYARTFAAFMAADALDDGRLDQEAQALLTLTTKHHFGFFYDLTLMQQGRIQIWRRRPEAGIDQIRAMLRSFTSQSIYLASSLHLGWLAEAQWQAGRKAEALDTLAQALAAADTRGERFHEAELHRLHGEWQWQRREVDAAAAHFHRALVVGRQQKARLFELRTLVTLAHMWQEAGDKAKADATRDALKSTYDWFTEGHDTPDLRAAHAVLVTNSAECLQSNA
jgi:DNA-binding SARP family transcriptional activator